MKRFRGIAIIAFGVAAILTLVSRTQVAWTHARSASGVADSQGCAKDNSGLKLPGGFCATIFADGIGHARDMAVTPSGVVYVNTWSGRYYGTSAPHEGGFLVALRDKTGAGKADVVERFGETVQSGGAGGSGIALYKDAIYAEINDRIVRYSLGGVFDCTKGCWRHRGFRIASDRGSSDASVRH